MSRAAKTLFGLLICAILLMTIIPMSLTADEADSSTSRGNPRGQGSPGLANDMWPGFRGGSTRTGNTTAMGADTYNLLWSKSIVIWWGSAVVQYDQIYVSYSGGTNCYDMDGNLVWSYNIGTRYGTPLVFNGRLYFVAESGNLYCLDANATGTGTTTNYWTYSPPSVVLAASSPITDGSKIYYSIPHSSGLYAVWLSNGTKAWNASLGGSTSTESSPAYWNGSVYCGGGCSSNGGSNGLYCFNATNGKLRWTFNAGDDICGTPAIEYDRVYFGALDGKIYCLGATGSGGTTTKHWEYNAGNVDFFGSPAVAYGRVYIGDTGSTLRCLNALATGGSTTQYWGQTLTPSSTFGIASSPAITPDYIFVGNGGHAIHCRNRTNGNLEWSQTFTSGTYGVMSPAVYKGKIVVTSDNGNLYVIGKYIDLRPPTIVSTDPFDGEIDVDVSSNITIKFNESIKLSSLTTSNLVLKDSQDITVPGTITADMSQGIEKAYYIPNEPLSKNETYSFIVTTDVTDLQDNTLDGNSNGIAEGVGIDDYEFNFTTVLQYPPIINPLPLLKPTEDIPYNRNLSAYINDLDSDKYSLIISEDSDYGTLTGFELDVLYPNGVLSDTFNITVSDGMFEVKREVNVQVKTVNDGPELEYIHELELTEDIMYTLNVKKHITDIDSPLSDLAMYDSTLSKYIDIDGLLINLTYPEGITEDLINITVWDTKDDTLSDYTEISISIEPVNDGPKIAELPGVSVQEDIEYEFSMEDYISDVDTPKENLVVTVNSPYVVVDGHKLLMTYPESVSSDILEVKVFDGEIYANVSLFIFLEAVNDPPIILSIKSPMEDDEFDFNESFDCIALVSDADLSFGDELTFLWFDHVSGEIATTQNVTGVKLSSGYHMVSFSVTDKLGARATMDINITVGEKPEDPKPEPNITDDPPKPTVNDDPEPTEKNVFSGPLMYGIIAIIIIVVILLVVLMMVKRKKKGEDTTKGPEGPGPIVMPEQPGPPQPQTGAPLQQGMPPMMQPPMQQQGQYMDTPPDQFGTMGQPPAQGLDQGYGYMGVDQQMAPQEQSFDQLQQTPTPQDGLPATNYDVPSLPAPEQTEPDTDQEQGQPEDEVAQFTLDPNELDQVQDQGQEQVPTPEPEQVLPEQGETMQLEQIPQQEPQPTPDMQVYPQQQQQQQPMQQQQMPMQQQPMQQQQMPMQQQMQPRVCSICGDMMVFNPAMNNYYCNVCHNVEY